MSSHNNDQYQKELEKLIDTKPLPMWHWRENNIYTHYDPKISSEIEAAFNNFHKNNESGPVAIQDGEYSIFFDRMRCRQRNKNKEKTIMRGIWFYQADPNREAMVPYEEEQAILLESIIQRGLFNEKIKVSDKPYRYVEYRGNYIFAQIRGSSLTVRKVQRGFNCMILKNDKPYTFKELPSTESVTSISLKPTNLPDLFNLGLKCYDNLDIEREHPPIARGSYGIVYKGNLKSQSNRIVVIKDLYFRNDNTIQDWSREVEIMARAKCPYVAQIFGFSSFENVLVIVMEYFPKGDLYNLLHTKHTLFSAIDRLNMVYHVLSGVNHLHKHYLFHRDLKSLNILVTLQNECKLTDFGMSKLVKDTDNELLQTANMGSPLWMAPEVKSGTYNYPSDIYSMGLVIYEIIEQKLPSWDKKISAVVLPEIFISAEIVKPLVVKDPTLRKKAPESIELFLEKYIKPAIEKIKKNYREVENISGEPFQIIEKIKDRLKDKDLEFIFGN